MKPKKKLRMQKALLRRQLELESWADGTSKTPLLEGQTSKNKQLIAEKDIKALKSKLGHDYYPS